MRRRRRALDWVVEYDRRWTARLGRREASIADGASDSGDEGSYDSILDEFTMDKYPGSSDDESHISVSSNDDEGAAGPPDLGSDDGESSGGSTMASVYPFAGSDTDGDDTPLDSPALEEEHSGEDLGPDDYESESAWFGSDDHEDGDAMLEDDEGEESAVDEDMEEEEESESVAEQPEDSALDGEIDIDVDGMPEAWSEEHGLYNSECTKDSRYSHVILTWHTCMPSWLYSIYLLITSISSSAHTEPFNSSPRTHT
ncbi:hypothetical protein Slin15195_G037610 [Septoria linicola]|uniref:Uncharacterized protein n=1 Tax=Septoria linicola TaxID=215465 RepID=A0A9Q9AQX5_9PEZI|nr:hypothetical protein Slin14017_G119020 [Septoria linicola]USW50442.1 hypothetical protein Slin15195_G037610 [Septoria linicola]